MKKIEPEKPITNYFKPIPALFRCTPAELRDKDYVMELGEGRAEKDVKALFFSLNSQEEQPQLKRVNMDMRKPFMNTIKDIAPQALIVHDKFHLFKNYQKP